MKIILLWALWSGYGPTGAEPKAFFATAADCESVKNAIKYNDSAKCIPGNYAFPVETTKPGPGAYKKVS